MDIPCGERNVRSSALSHTFKYVALSKSVCSSTDELGTAGGRKKCSNAYEGCSNAGIERMMRCRRNEEKRSYSYEQTFCLSFGLIS